MIFWVTDFVKSPSSINDDNDNDIMKIKYCSKLSTTASAKLVERVHFVCAYNHVILNYYIIIIWLYCLCSTNCIFFVKTVPMVGGRHSVGIILGHTG